MVLEVEVDADVIEVLSLVETSDVIGRQGDAAR